MGYKSDFEDATGWSAIDTNIKLIDSSGKRFRDFLKNQGVSTIIRYYASSKLSKTISGEEANILSSDGFNILPVFQDRNRKPSDFGGAKGRESASRAAEFAREIGQPKGTTILFAADADFSSSEIDHDILPYFEEINRLIGSDYRIGAYGSGLLLKTLLDEDLIEVPWISMSRGFRGTKEFFYSTQWALRQIPPDLKYEHTDISYDRNFLKWSPEDIGVFKLGATATHVSVPSQPVMPSGIPGTGVQPASGGTSASAAPTANAFITTNAVNFRAAPDGAIIRELTVCDPVTALATISPTGWIPVQIGTQQGYVFGRYLRSPLASPIEALLRNLVDEWIRFKKGQANERTDPYYKFVGEMWASIGLNYDGRSLYPDGREVPWSAAFISYVVRKSGAAYAKFRFDASHSTFSHDAIQGKVLGRTDRPFWGYRRSDAKPELGDIIHRNRGSNNFTYDYTENHSSFESHSDAVVEVTSHVVRVIGGNVGDTVSMSEVVGGDNLQEYNLDSQGFIADGQRVIAVLKNRSASVT